MISGPKIRKISEKFLKFFVGGIWALRKSSKNHFPMLRVIIFRSFSSFFFVEIWALLESFKNDFPMVMGTNLRSFSSFFVCLLFIFFVFEIWDL